MKPDFISTKTRSKQELQRVTYIHRSSGLEGQNAVSSTTEMPGDCSASGSLGSTGTLSSLEMAEIKVNCDSVVTELATQNGDHMGTTSRNTTRTTLSVNDDLVSDFAHSHWLYTKKDF